MLRIKYQNSKLCGFREGDFLKFPYENLIHVSTRAGSFLAQGSLF